MRSEVQIADLNVELVRKRIKNLHLRVLPPEGKISISAPIRMSFDVIHAFAMSKYDWIKKQQEWILKCAAQQEPVKTYMDQEIHFVWGLACVLNIKGTDKRPKVELDGNVLQLHISPAASKSKKAKLLETWYRRELEKVVPVLVEKWEPLMNVKVKRLSYRLMSTRWGSCTPRDGSIRFNTELARRAPDLLEYVVVHEMVHLLEPSHNSRFVRFMDEFLPNWRECKKRLSRKLS